MNGIIEWILFSAFSLIAVTTAAGMILTMSMYRAGLALMASFVSLAGLFILLNTDLLAAIQIMMNVGGMLVMVLFMVMIMMDPGGEMMWGMKRDMHMPGPGAFSMHMPRGKPPEAENDKFDSPGNMNDSHMHAAIKNDEQDPMQETTYTCPMHPEIKQNQPGICPKCGMNLIPVQQQEQKGMEMHGEMSMSQDNMDMNMNMDMTPQQNYQMMVDMAVSTSQLPWAIALGIASALLLILLFVQTPWPLSHIGPTQDATTMVGELLLSRYMIGFEGAAFLILSGIVGAVIFARRERPKGQPTEAQTHSHKQDALVAPDKDHQHGGSA
jgi:NADH-quinone oxidoreductase subunit J